MAHIIDNITVEGDALIFNFVLPANSTATTLNGTLTMTSSSSSAQLLAGTATGYSVQLPDATTIPQGHKYEIYNTTTQNVLIKDGSGATLFTFAANSTAYIYLQSNATVAGTWLCWQIISNPNIASGIVNYKVVASTSFATASATDVLITGFQVTPIAGTYAVWANANASNTSGTANAGWSLYSGGSIVSDSTRGSRPGASGTPFQMTTMSSFQVNGSQAVELRVNTSAGTLTVTGRTLLLIRLGT